MADDMSSPSDSVTIDKIVERRILAAKTDSERVAAVLPAFLLLRLARRVANLLTYDPCLKDADTSISERIEGNIAFGKEDYDEALSLYTQSIASAPFNSKELAFAFANRSAVLRTLGHLRACIADIHRAFDHAYPESHRHKLLLREATCLRDLGEVEEAAETFRMAEGCVGASRLSAAEKTRLVGRIQKEVEVVGTPPRVLPQASSELPPLSDAASPEAPCLSQAVGIEHNEAFGRHLVANRDIKIGEVVLAERPFAATLYPAFRLSHCSHCMRRSLALLPCQTCVGALFCSEGCRTEAVLRYHGVECLAVQRHLVLAYQERREVDDHELLAMRIVATVGFENLLTFLETAEGEGSQDARTRGFNAEGWYDSADFTTVYNLESNISKLPITLIVKHIFAALNILESFETGDDRNIIKLGGVIFRLLSVLHCNSHAVTELLYDGDSYTFDKIASGLYPTASLASHSCNPNVLTVNYGSSLAYRVLRTVKKGSQVCLSYRVCFDRDELPQRRAVLAHYFFECRCEACTNNWPVFRDLPEYPSYRPGRVLRAVQASKNRLTGSCSSKATKSLETMKSSLSLYESHLALLNVHGKDFSKEYFVLKYDVGYCYHMLGNYLYVKK